MNTERFEALAEAVVAASLERVWDALATGEGFAQVYEGITVESRWVVGAPIVWTGTWEGKPFRDEGTILTYDRPRTFAYTYWTSFWGPEPTPETVQTIVNTFEPVAGGTRVVIRQTNIATAESRDHSQKNWQTILDKAKDGLR